MSEQRKNAAAAVESNKLKHAGTASLILASAGFLAGCTPKPPAAPPPQPMPVTVVTLEPTDVPISGEWVGTLDGYVNATIQPQANGYLIKQDYREGTQVSKGQVLFEIDPRPFQAALDQAKGQLEQAKGQVAQAQAQLGLAQINVNRDTPLAQARAIAQSTLDNDTQQKAQQEAAVKSAQANVSAAEATVENAKLNLGFTQVRSLISGVAGQATLQVGNLVNTQSVLTSVSQLNPIKAYFSISDSEYLALVQRTKAGGGDLLKNASAVPLTLTLSNGEAYAQKGHIAYVDRQINAQTGAIRIAASFPNPGNVLRPGQFGRIKADTQVRHNTLLIPQVAIQELQGLQQAYIAGPDNKAHLVTLKLGPQVGTNWVVEDGVSPGARVITDNLLKLGEGSPVAPHDGPPAAPTSQATSSAGSK
ncbi:efflux RND transporter periplasmic adaptor subunit [Granulicella tundricola]|uniref:Efflux transporter, RND family, MFP subunit n=1 Tax=Granulicella tundricola (strain ATCC BAA-1859 / DSM 23138 / MP5ACTX9) TaxID=1198114 RepID=E8WVA7_GRATM|nr:efflux RND transporter periplasmic adaptor subunit [Granulicella tundricola]ADW67282.1 efflux transporter, RND family, MFP subunit [Granulicella tundricola MP5ACTX9]